MNIKYGFTVRVYCRLKVLLMGRRKVFEFHRHVLCSMSESIFLLLFLLDEAAVCNASLNPSSRYTRFAKVAGDASKSRAWEHNQFPNS